MARKPVQTMYAGCHFRSRLEARWAVFFDTAGIPWEYEPEGFDIDGTWYLPDFRLPECGTWIEVKGILRDRDRDLLETAVDYLPVEPDGGEDGPPLLLVGSIPDIDELPMFDRTMRWDLAWIEPGRRAWGFGSYEKQRRPWWIDMVRDTTVRPIPTDSEYMRPGIEAAYRKARAARFEHGQKG